MKEGKEGYIQQEFIEAIRKARKIEAGEYRVRALAPLRRQWKDLLLPCSRHLEAAYQMCGLVAQVYLEQASDTVRVVAETQTESRVRELIKET